MTITITLLALCAWLTVWFLIIRHLIPVTSDLQVLRAPPAINLLWLVALLLHGTSLCLMMMQNAPISLHFTATASLVMWLSALILFFAQLKRPLTVLGIFLIPLVVLSLFIQLLPTEQVAAIPLADGVGLHIVSSLLAFSLLVLAALQAILLAIQNYRLRHHQPTRLIRALPPLLDMEAMLFQFITTGMIFLSIGLISGFVYLDGLFGHHIAHKTILSLAAWIIFATLLIGHWRFGWRGKIAIRWTLTGVFILALGFLGSKFILEYWVKISGY